VTNDHAGQARIGQGQLENSLITQECDPFVDVAKASQGLRCENSPFESDRDAIARRSCGQLPVLCSSGRFLSARCWQRGRIHGLALAAEIFFYPS